MATITVIPKKDNAKSRRLAKQMAFWDKKRAEHEAKPKSRSVNEIIDSIIKPVDETDVLANLIITLKSNDKPENTGSHCLHNTWLYSVR
ncbi:hypothetical protein [Photorhabdus luminescens]|uniref:hypothetical protein n=1 Tax=Photorhabdus luminescens TaxID=29488 RepID=UPI0022400C9E|nr:hypothetical protein [Photorhabdus luminescens]MCW7764450.1 hypothetical protein [Photorhabdus luminescens subsp. venezuelensis]